MRWCTAGDILVFYVFGGGLERGVLCPTKQPRSLRSHFMDHSDHRLYLHSCICALQQNTDVRDYVIFTF